jgi:hypothetical protein
MKFRKGNVYRESWIVDRESWIVDRGSFIDKRYTINEMFRDENSLQSFHRPVKQWIWEDPASFWEVLFLLKNRT